MRHHWIAYLFVLLTIQPSVRAQQPPTMAAQEPVLVTISEKTTRITEPTKASGYPNFLEALHTAAKGKITEIRPRDYR